MTDTTERSNARTGRIEAIHVAPRPDADADGRVDAIEAIAGRGLRGDATSEKSVRTTSETT